MSTTNSLWTMTIVSAPTPKLGRRPTIDRVRYYEYKTACVLDSLTWAQAAFCPELMYYQLGILDPTVPEHRGMFEKAVAAWETFINVRRLPVSHVVYLDFVREMTPEDAETALKSKLDARNRVDRKLPAPEMKRLQQRWGSDVWKHKATILLDVWRRLEKK